MSEPYPEQKPGENTGEWKPNACSPVDDMIFWALTRNLGEDDEI